MKPNTNNQTNRQYYTDWQRILFISSVFLYHTCISSGRTMIFGMKVTSRQMIPGSLAKKQETFGIDAVRA
jgi:hypothetical protein